MSAPSAHVSADHSLPLNLHRDGAAHYSAAAAALLPSIEHALTSAPRDRAGVRLTHTLALAALLSTGTLHQIAAAAIGASARPVRAVLFDKSPHANWALGWHQDRTIAVRERRDVPGYGPWSRKQGLLHVEPPFAIIERMATLRIHLDDVPADNAPLLIAPGSHSLGRLPVADVGYAVARCGIHACLARRGDIWAYATPILHASAAAERPVRRRVLQVDYSADHLPGGLAWLGL